MGEKRDEYVEKLKGNIDQWNAEIDRFQTKADRAQEDVKEEYRKCVEELKVKRQAVEEKMTALKASSGTAWEDVKSGLDRAWTALGESVEAAKSRFK